MSFLDNLFGKKQPAAAKVSPKTGPAEIGILFDIDELGGGFYGYEAYKIFFKNLDPKRLTACTLFDGDTNDTLAGRARLYCIAVHSVDASKINYIKETLSKCGDKGLLAVNRRFLEGNITNQQPLVLAAEIDSAGNLVVKKGSMIGKGWIKGTTWSIVEI